MGVFDWMTSWWFVLGFAGSATIIFVSGLITGVVYLLVNLWK